MFVNLISSGNRFLLSNAITDILTLDKQYRLEVGNINRHIVEQRISEESGADRLKIAFRVLNWFGLFRLLSINILLKSPYTVYA